MGETMEDLVRDVSTVFPQADGEQGEAKDGGGAAMDMEICMLRERVREQMDKLVQSLISADREQEKRQAIPTLQSISDAIGRLCAAHGQPPAIEELDDEKVEVTDSGNLNEEEEEKEEHDETDMSGGEGGVAEESAVGGDNAAAETNTCTETKRAGDEVDYAEYEEEAFARFRRGWEHLHGNYKSSFEDLTLFSPMLFTHCTPGFKPIDGVVVRTLQICSIKVTDLKHFDWPLQVYGVVAARDAVDERRNPIFLRPRDNYQILHEADPFLYLTGPVRAIMSEEPVDIEIQLKVRGTSPPEDRALVSYVHYYDGGYAASLSPIIIEKHSCTLELCVQQLKRSVQATIFGAHVVVDDKSNPFEHGVRVVSSSLSQQHETDPSMEVVLLDSKVGRKRAVKCGYLNLSRQVVSVSLGGKLKVLIQAYTPSGGIAAQGHVLVAPKSCNTSQHACDLNGCMVEFTVAWSYLVEDVERILMNGRVDPFAACPIDPCLLLKEITVKPAKVVQKWQPPDDPFIKVNVDASFHEETHQGGTGLGIRNHKGTLLRAQAVWYDAGLSAMAMEAYAIRDGVQLACDLGMQKVIVETSAQTVVYMWSTRCFDRSEVAATLHEIEGLCENLEEFRLAFVPREANELAHLCAKQCSASRRRCLWINYIPTFLADCVKKECSPTI
ncbi:hypothetical protein ACQJBY_012702 [Aegilops geniculata]